MRHSVSAIIEDVPVGLYHYRLMALLAGAYAIDGAKILEVSSTADAVLHGLEASEWFRGITVAILFLGAIVGNLGGGMLSDAHGRRPLVLTGLAGMIIASLVESQARAIMQLLVSRFVFGVAMGFAVTTQNALVLEMTSSSSRATMSATLQSMFGVGEFYASLLLVFYMPRLESHADEWREMTVLVCLPAVICLPLCYFYLDESPIYLMTHGKEAEALDILIHAADINASPVADNLRDWRNDGSMAGSSGDYGTLTAMPEAADADEDTYTATWTERLKLCFSHELLYVTAGCMFVCFVCNFNMVGIVYLQPDILSLFLTVSPAKALLFGALFHIPSTILSVYLVGTNYHFSNLIAVGFACCAVSVVLIAVPNFYVSFPAVCVSKCLVGMSFSLFFIYVGEEFPTICRATGTGLALGAGRIGSVVTPLIYDAILSQANLGHIHGRLLFLGIASVLLAVGAVIMAYMPVGRKNLQLLHRPSSFTSALKKHRSGSDGSLHSRYTSRL